MAAHRGSTALTDIGPSWGCAAGRRDREDRARPRGVSMSTIALLWVLKNPVVDTPIVGATKKHHLPDAVTAWTWRSPTTRPLRSRSTTPTASRPTSDRQGEEAREHSPGPGGQDTETTPLSLSCPCAASRRRRRRRFSSRRAVLRAVSISMRASSDAAVARCRVGTPRGRPLSAR